MVWLFEHLWNKVNGYFMTFSPQNQHRISSLYFVFASIGFASTVFYSYKLIEKSISSQKINTKTSPYYAVMFKSIRDRSNKENNIDYNQTGEYIEDLAKKQDGFIDVEDFYNEKTNMNITISYWKSLQHIAKWRQNIEHIDAQNKGKSIWYKYYKLRVAKVEREYEFHNPYL